MNNNNKNETNRHLMSDVEKMCFFPPCRFDVHSKLVSFMAPFENCEWTDDARYTYFT